MGEGEGGRGRVGAAKRTWEERRGEDGGEREGEGGGGGGGLMWYCTVEDEPWALEDGWFTGGAVHRSLVISDRWRCGGVTADGRK